MCVCVCVCVCMYIYVIVGNCSKCCWRVLNTHECRAKYSSKWLNEACIIPCNSEFRAYALVRFNLRQIQFTHSSDRSRVRKHETQSYRESCVFHFSHFELYIYLYMYVHIYIYICICNNQVLSLCKFIKFINDSTKILNNKIPWWVSNHKTGLMKV